MVKKDKFLTIVVPALLEVIIIILTIFLIYSVLASIFLPKYEYIDMYGSAGVSNKCYYDNNAKDMRCMIAVKVQQYSKK